MSALGAAVVVAFVVLASVLFLTGSRDSRLGKLLALGLLLRLAGGLTYLYILETFYPGGDYRMYFAAGAQYVEEVASGDVLAAVHDYGRFWGTPAVITLSALIQALLGSSMILVFLAFSLISYVGILAVGIAFRGGFPGIEPQSYYSWIVIFPSLWFWPSALGKDAVVLAGIGLAALGFAGSPRHINWLLIAAGAALVFIIRPQVATVLLVCLAGAQWLTMIRQWSLKRVGQSVLLAALMVGAAWLASQALGFDLLDPEAAEEYMGYKAKVTAYGGSALTSTSPPWARPLVGFVTTFFRPFPWEISGMTMLLASLEIWGLWGIAWLRRRQIIRFIRQADRGRLFWLAVLFVAVYGTLLGMSLGNMGTLARQRVHLFPFLFVFFANPPAQHGSIMPDRPAQMGGPVGATT